MHERLFHAYNNTKQKYATVAITRLRYHMDISLPIWRKYAYNTKISTKNKKALCHHVKQEFGFNLFYDTYFTPISYSVLKVYRAFLEGGFVSVWMSGSYKIRRDSHLAKMHYQNYWGFGNPDFSVVHAINPVPVFSITAVLLIGFCFPAFIAEHAYGYYYSTNIKQKKKVVIINVNVGDMNQNFFKKCLHNAVGSVL